MFGEIRRCQKGTPAGLAAQVMLLSKLMAVAELNVGKTRRAEGAVVALHDQIRWKTANQICELRSTLRQMDLDLTLLYVQDGKGNS